MKKNQKLAFVLILAGLSVVQACKKDKAVKAPVETPVTQVPAPQVTPSPTPTPTPTPPSPDNSRLVDWTSWGTTDGTYTNTHFASDFGNLSGTLGTGHTKIVNQAMEYTLFGETEAQFTGGGTSPNVDIVDGSEYEVEYKIKFHTDFVWSLGGKLGFGFKIGNGYNGCDANATDGGGGSARLMWYKYSNGDVTLRPYIYHKDMPGPCGDYLTGRYPATGSLQKEVWYTVKMRVKSNTGTNTDGRITYIINGTTIVDRAVRWTTNDTKRLINIMSFHTHRGGGSNWTATQDSKLYYDDIKWTKIN